MEFDSPKEKVVFVVSIAGAFFGAFGGFAYFVLNGDEFIYANRWQVLRWFAAVFALMTVAVGAALKNHWRATNEQNSDSSGSEPASSSDKQIGLNCLGSSVCLLATAVLTFFSISYFFKGEWWTALFPLTAGMAFLVGAILVPLSEHAWSIKRRGERDDAIWRSKHRR